VGRAGIEAVRNLVVASAVMLTGVTGIAATGDQLSTRPVPDFVVSEIVLPLAAPALRATLLEGLRAEPEHQDPAYRAHGFKTRDGSGREEPVPVMAEGSDHALFGKTYFRDPAHSQDLFVHFMGEAIVSSYFYDASTGKGLDYGVTFAVAIEGLDASRSRVSVSTLKSQVYVGKALDLHALGRVPEARPAPPSPLDQYRLLVYLVDLASARATSPGGMTLPNLP
jgi:hypothetical protein